MSCDSGFWVGIWRLQPLRILQGGRRFVGTQSVTSVPGYLAWTELMVGDVVIPSYLPGYFRGRMPFLDARHLESLNM